MRILITGSSGFIGSHSMTHLWNRGHDVIGVDKKGSSLVHHSSPLFRTENVNILNDIRLRKIFESFKPNAVLHLAANSSLQRSLSDPVYDAANNIMGTLNVLKFARDNNCNRIVFASTSAVYSPQSPIPYYESFPREPVCPYGISKAACEMYIEISGLNFAILRYANVYGPGQKPLGENILIARALDHIINGKPFKINGDGEQVRDWVYVTDVADANLIALKDSHNGIYNVASGNGLSVNYVVLIIKHLLNFDPPIEHGPANRGELREVVMDPHHIWHEMGWRSRTQFADGIKLTIESWTKK